jgi:hypothetical protein
MSFGFCIAKIKLVLRIMNSDVSPALLAMQGGAVLARQSFA